MSHAAHAGDARTARAVGVYLRYDGLLGAAIGGAAAAFAWPGTTRVSPWADVLAVPLLVLIAIGLALVRSGRLCGRLIGDGGCDRLAAPAARRFITVRVTVWAAAGVASAAAGPGAVAFQFALALMGLPFAGYALWRAPWTSRRRALS